MIPECMEHTAVRELLSEDEPEGYIETIDEMFETWLGSDLINGTTGNQRALAYQRVKAIKKLMESIK